MAITKEILVDEITIIENGIILYRESISFVENNKQINQSYHRSSLVPGQDLNGIPSNVSAICNVVWTAEVIKAYQTQIIEQQNKI
jgi:hypothetical protein